MITEQLLIPTVMADITPAWLTAALDDAFPGVHVEALETKPLHDGTAFTCRVHVTYREGGPVGPDTVCVKAGMEAPFRKIAMEGGMYCKEAIAYREVFPLTKARVAKSFNTGYDLTTGAGYVLMEDLNAAGSTFCAAENPLTPDQVADGLGQFAELHALYWNDPRIEEAQWRHRGRTLAEPDSLHEYFFGENWGPSLAVPHAGVIPQLFQREEVLRPALARLRSLDDAAAICLIHGDAHIGNIFLTAEGRPCMADFQGIQRGHYSHDLSMFIGSSLDLVDRRRHERDLVQSYVDALSRLVDTPPSFEEAWLGYRRHYLYGTFAWLLTTDLYQTQLRCVATTHRFAMAALDLDSLEAIGA